ncbi:hypothetical protein [Zobellella sp. An-6]|uniref:hypothetical protein n=1 Tax=Zobellella sp. An-6 TaxID=3400218 RepID=UPI0040422519
MLLWVNGGLANEQDARWLSNTFRIDPSISAVTLFIEREAGSPSVVLIRPDGSKYYYQRHPSNINWASTASRDVITLWQPEPGPWQATGKISEQRGISLVSAFSLRLEPLPPRVYQQEVIKLGAELVYDETRLDAAYYLDGLSLTAQLVGQRGTDEDAFTQAPQVIGVFADDGTNLDEYPGDGKMTAEVIVDALPGRYLFQAQTTNRVLARTYEQELLVYPMPISLRFSTPGAEGNWQLTIDADGELLPDSLVVAGELSNPLGQTLPVSGQGRVITLPDARQPGNYRWQGRAFATTRDGREIQLNLMEQVVRVLPPVVAASASPVKEPPFWLTLPYLVGGGVGLLLLLSGVGGLIWRRRRRATGQRPG